MTKSQNKIYNWLKEHKGYLKCSPGTVLEYYWNYLEGEETVYSKDVDVALKKARNDFKNNYKPSSSVFCKEIKTNYNTSFLRPSRNPKNILVLPDLHLPFSKKGIMEHCLKMQDKYNCGRIVVIGDEVDLCAISQWEKDPDGFSAGTEAKLAQDELKKYYEAFPEAMVCIGNHTARPFRMAKSNGIPKKFIKSYEEAWEAPSGWKWSENWEVDNVLYTHGTGYSGANAAIRIATRHRQSTVIGHIHSEAGIQYSASKIDLVWGMQVGGALDDKSYAAFYAKDQLKKSIVGCGIVIDGRVPVYEPMIM